MPRCKSTPVKITTFINPHLFFIFENETAGKRQALEAELESLPHEFEDKATIGKHVLVFSDQWKRAVIKSMDSGYNCWLIDYGEFHQTKKVFKLPTKYTSQKPMVKQAALDNVVCVTEVLGPIEIEKIQTTEFNQGVNKCAQEHIHAATSIFFYCIKEINNIHIGELNIVGRGGLYGLSEILIDSGLLAENEELFKTALEENSKLDDKEFLKIMNAAVPCAGTILKNKCDPLQDIVESKGVGRGARNSPNQETMPGGSGYSNKTFLEKWVEESKATTTEKSFESDNDSKKDLSITNKNVAEESTAQSSASNVNLKSTSPDVSDSVSQTDVSPPKTNYKNPSSASNGCLKSTSPDVSDSVSQRDDVSPPKTNYKNPLQALMHFEATRNEKEANSWASKADDSSSNISWEINCAKSVDSFDDNEPNQNENQMEISDQLLNNESTFSPKINSSPLTDSSMSYSSFGRGRSINNESSLNRGQSFEDTKTSGAGSIGDLETSPNGGLDNKRLNMLKSLRRNSSSPKQEHSPQTSEKPTGNSTAIPESNSKKQMNPKVVSWSDFPDEKAKTSESIRHLNITPSGMALKSESQKKSSLKKNVRVGSSRESKSVSEGSMNASSRSSDKPDDNRSVTSSVSASASNKNITPTELSNMETPRRPCPFRCKCVQCREWNSDTLFEVEAKTKFASEAKPKKLKECIKPPLLFKTETEQNEDVIKSYNYINPAATKTERATAPKVLVHGLNIPSPLKAIMDVPFHADIHRALRSFEHSMSIQSFVWPALMRHLNVCMVSPPKSGKTMAYLPAICSYLLERDERYKDLPRNTISPIAIILCPGTEISEKVYNRICNTTRNCKNQPIPALAIPPMDKKCLSQFQKQCDILVATPMTLVALLRARIITMKRLCHFVIENADKILEKFPKEMDNLFGLIQNMLSHRSCYYTVLLVVTAEEWTIPLEKLMKRLNSTPIICIGSHLEAAMYGKVQLKMHFKKSQAKMPLLAKVLQNEANVRKTVVICNTDEEIEEVKEYLLISGVQSVIIYDSMEQQEILDCEMRWLNSVGGKHLALLCTDKIYSHSLHISNAVTLVHYSLPETWTKFMNRFSCMLDNYKSPLTSKEPNMWTRCSVEVFADESCTKEFAKLMEFLLRMRVDITPNFLEFYKRTVEEKEMEKVVSKFKLCQNLKLFGTCSMVKCNRRHMLSSEIDCVTDLHKRGVINGVIKFKILHMQDVTCMTVKLLQHTNSEGKTQKLETYDSLQEDLQKAMVDRICVFNTKPRGWYAWHSLENRCYYRCAIQKILKFEPITKRATDVTVRLLDTGERRIVSTLFLYELPNKFHSIPPIGVDVFLANMVPPEQDNAWSSDSKSKAINILHEAGCFSKNTYGASQVLLQLGGIIWVKNILFLEDLSAINVTVTKLNVRKAFQDQNLISSCEKQLEGLYKLCKDANIELPDYSLPVRVNKLTKSEEQVQPQWAFLENIDCNEVFIINLDTPSLFYVRLMKFYDLFENLQKDIQEAIAKPFYPSKFEVQVDKYYLAKDPGSDNFCRVKILEIKEDMVEVFYVDFGDSATVNIADLKYLSDELIVKLPFQAIECRLYGINPPLGDWQSMAIDIVYGYIFEPNTDIYRTLYTTTCKQEPAFRTGGQKCAILLVDNFKGKPILLNQLLIDCGEAVAVNDEDLDKEFKVPEKFVEEEEPDWDIDSNKDFTFDDLKILKKKYGTEEESNNTKKAIQAKDNERCESRQSNESHHSWDIEINDAETFMKQLIGVQIEQPPAPIQQERELPPMRALPPAKHCTPNVIWYQTETHIKLNIILPNLNEYDVHVIRQRLLMFKATYNDKHYRVDLQLFDKVEKTFQDSPSGPHVKITLTKSNPGEWPRLINSAQRMRHIKYDISQCVLPEEKEKPFLQLGKDLDGDLPDDDNVHDFVYGSDENYSESDPESTHTSD